MIHNTTSVPVPPLTPAEMKPDWTHAGTEMRGQHNEMYEIALNMVIFQGMKRNNW